MKCMSSPLKSFIPRLYLGVYCWFSHAMVSAFAMVLHNWTSSRTNLRGCGKKSLLGKRWACSCGVETYLRRKLRRSECSKPQKYQYLILTFVLQTISGLLFSPLSTFIVVQPCGSSALIEDQPRVATEDTQGCFDNVSWQSPYLPIDELRLGSEFNFKAVLCSCPRPQFDPANEVLKGITCRNYRPSYLERQYQHRVLSKYILWVQPFVLLSVCDHRFAIDPVRKAPSIIWGEELVKMMKYFTPLPCLQLVWWLIFRKIFGDAW